LHPLEQHRLFTAHAMSGPLLFGNDWLLRG
jgi:hypothetical protein